MVDQYVKHDQDDYTQSISELRPTGPAWPRDPESTQMKFLNGIAGTWGNEVANAADSFLVIESFPPTSINLLPEWEKSFGLPDLCLDEPVTIAARHTALVNRMTTIGGSSRAFFIAEAAAIGYGVTITEYRPFMVGIDMVGDNRVLGDGTPKFWYYNGAPVLNTKGLPVGNGEYSEYPYMLGPPENRYYWTVHVTTLVERYFHCASGQCGIDPLLYIGLATDLECLFRRYKPGHTYVIFDYTFASPPFAADFMSGPANLGTPTLSMLVNLPPAIGIATGPAHFIPNLNTLSASDLFTGPAHFISLGYANSTSGLTNSSPTATAPAFSIAPGAALFASNLATGAAGLGTPVL